MSTYWVIREGKVRGQGRYLQGDIRSVWGARSGAAQFASEEDARRWFRDALGGRIVYVSRPEKVDRALYDDALAKLALAVNERDSLMGSRERALDEAERVLRGMAEEWEDRPPYHGYAAVVRGCAARIATLKGGAR